MDSKVSLIQAHYFKMLMHPTRLAILEILRDGEECVCHLEAVLGLRQAHISQHLMILREADLVSDRRDGWNIFYKVTKPEIFQVIDAMNSFVKRFSSESVPLWQKTIQQGCICPRCKKSEITSLIDFPLSTAE